MEIAVVGGGITGLAVAYELTARGHRVEVFEKGRPGGLAGGFPYHGSDVSLEKCYHHIFTSDAAILGLIEEHGLSGELLWQPTRSGLIADGKTWPFGSPLDLLRFRPLGSLGQRVRMGWNLWSLARIDDWSPLDAIRCREYFQGRGNLPGYRALWEPLLKQKFADAFDDIPVSFLWGRLRPRAGSRRKGQESLGYLQGGFQRLFMRMAEAIRARGGEVHTGRLVRAIRPADRPVVVCGRSAAAFDRVVWTADLKRLCRTVEQPPAELAAVARQIEYMAVTQLILVARRRQTDYYWLNNLDPTITFGGLIEHTNMIPAEHYGGDHILYLVNYHRPGDPRFAGKTAECLLDFHAPSLARMIPGFCRQDIQRLYVIRNDASSPLYDLGYGRRRPPHHGWLPGVDVCGMAQVYPEDRNMSHAVDLARRYVAERF